MKISKLKAQRKDPLRVNIEVDGHFFCGVTINVVAKYNLFVGKEMTEEELDTVFMHEIKGRFLERAIEYFARGPRTEVQIKKNIRELSYKKKGQWYEDISKETVEEILEYVMKKLADYGYIDDKRYAQAYLESKVKNKPTSKFLLVGELIKRGIKKDEAEEYVNEFVDDEYDLLKRAYFKRYKEEKITMEDRDKIDFLRRKGFTWDLIEEYISNESSE